MTQLFSIVAMFIMFRETLEACIVVAVMLNLCVKLNMLRMKRQVWLGVTAGVALSVLIGVIFIVVFYVTKNSVFSGSGKAIFKGYVNLLASYLIALLGFAMLRFANYEKKWERKLKLAHRSSERKQKETGRAANWAIFLLCFSAVFREGIEAVVFLAGASTTESITAIPIAAVVGIIIGVTCGFLLFFTGRQIKDMWWFFVISFILLFMIGAGLVSTGLSSWQSIGWWGSFYPTVYRPWWNQAVWDTCGCCNDSITVNKFFGLMNAIFGYQCQPTFISLFSYCMFWIIILTIVLIKFFKGSLTDAAFKLKKKENKRRALLGLPPMTPEEEERFMEADLEERFEKGESDADSTNSDKDQANLNSDEFDDSFKKRAGLVDTPDDSSADSFKKGEKLVASDVSSPDSFKKPSKEDKIEVEEPLQKP